MIFMKTSTVVSRLYSVSKSQSHLIFLAVLSDILKHGVTLGCGYFGVELLKMARRGESPDILLQTGLLIMIFAVLRGLFGYLSIYLAHVGSYRILTELRNSFYRIIEPLAPAALMNRRTGDIASVAGNNIETLELFFAHTIAPAASSVVIPAFIFIFLYFIHPAVALTFLICVVSIALLPYLSLRLNEKCGVQLRHLIADIKSFVIDTVQGIREILAFSMAHERYTKAMDMNRTYIRNSKKYIYRNSYITSFHVLVISGGVLLLLAVSAYLSREGLLDPVHLPIIILFSSVGFNSMNDIVNISKQFGLTFSGARRLFELTDMKPVVSEPQDPVRFEDIVPSVSFKNVSFEYLPNQPVLNNVSFDIPSGKTVAIVGMTGSGKTTIAHLIMRFWDPVSGVVEMGGYDLKTLPLQKIRSMVSVVSQDIFLLNTSIMENIRLGNSEATDEDVMNAARMARIHDFVASLPEGYQTIVGERGIKLSGGERQRIAISRAFLKNAPILILDEATSALDTCTEMEIRAVLNQLCKGKTILMISHRLFVVSESDNILVIQNGTIKEEGTHPDLIELNGIYASFIQAQKL